MKNPLTIFKPKHERQQDLKNRILKNKEGVLDVLSENIQGARQCPHLLMNKCVGQFCEKFMKFYSSDNNGNKKEFWRCAEIQTPLLLIEINESIRNLINILQEEKENVKTAT